MKSIIIAGLAAMATLTAAAPHKPKRYLLKTESVLGPLFDGLYVSTYHTAAGENIAQLIGDKKYAVPAYIKDKSLYFDLGNHPNEQYPMQIHQTDLSSAFGTTSINIDEKPIGEYHYKDGYLTVNNFSKKLLNTYDHGASWRVCKWTHGVPELFWNFPYTTDNIHPKFNPPNCAFVNLKLVPV